MRVKLLHIQAKRRPDPFSISSPSDFVCAEEESVDAHIVIRNPDISLYCLDHKNQTAMFVETPTGTDLSQAPFYYQAQYENATRLIVVPFGTFHQLASSLHLDPQRLSLIYSTSRSGSTLLCSAFNQVEGVATFSEPDVFSQLVELRAWDGSRDAEIGSLLRSCTRILCGASNHVTHPRACAIKFRGFGVEAADLMYEIFPDARIIFLYRDAISWLQSVARAFMREDHESEEYLASLQRQLSLHISKVAHYSAGGEERPSIIKLAMLAWLSTLERYLELHEQGAPVIAARFKDLISSPEEILGAIFRFCHIDVNDLSDVTRVLERDSQAGTDISRKALRQREIRLPKNYLAEVHNVLKEQATIRRPDFVLPGTLKVSPVQRHEIGEQDPNQAKRHS
jgi:hypothetical protein